MNTQFNSNVIWLQLEYKISTLGARAEILKKKFLGFLIEMVTPKVDILYSNCSHITFELK